MRAPLAPPRAKSWTPIYLWADPTYAGGDRMHFAMEADEYPPPPQTWAYVLELLHVPTGVMGAPPVGTQWHVLLKGTLVLDLPTFRTEDGRAGYQFAFTVTPEVPEPAGLGTLAVVVACMRRALRRT